MSNKDFIEIGKITKHHGIKGYAKFYYFGDKNNFYYKEVFLEDRGELLSYFIEDWYFYKNFIILKLKDINSINDVNSKIKGKTVYINKKQLKKLDENEFYWYQLIGLEVYDINDDLLGVLEEIVETGSNDVFVVKKDNKEILVPYTDDVVRNIDLKSGKMVVYLLEEV